MKKVSKLKLFTLNLFDTFYACAHALRIKQK